MVRLLAVTAVGWAALASAGDLPRLAVLGVRTTGGVEPGSAKLLTELLTDDLGRAGKWRVVSSLELTTLLGVERQKTLSGCEDSGCLVELSQALGAEWLVDGSVGAMGNLRVLTVRLFDARKQQVERRESITVDDDAALVDGLHTLSSRLTGLSSSPRASSLPRPGWLVFGAGVLLGLGGAGTGVGALSQYDQYKANPANVSLHENARTLGYVADGLYGAAIVAGAVALVMLVFHVGEPARAP